MRALIKAAEYNKEKGELYMKPVETACSFLKDCGTYFLATVDNDQPRVRPFGTAHIFENRLYFQTGLSKEVAKQITKNPNVELSGFHDGKWIRIRGEAVYDPRVEAQESLLDAYPSLKGMYKAGDGNTAVYYLKDVKAIISSFTEEPVTMEF